MQYESDIFIFLLNLALPLNDWVFFIRGNYKVASFTFNVEQILLVLSCIVLIWALPDSHKFSGILATC
jgi:hypothetical protein